MDDLEDVRFPREHYIKRLRELRGMHLIKAIVGIRRCGKTCIMEEFIDVLRSEGVPESRLFYVNLEDSTCNITSSSGLVDAAVKAVGNLKGSYLFIDEVQAIKGWEGAIDTFNIKGADVYITGSNSQMLSSELSTKLSGRCVEIRAQPLVFSEYAMFRKDSGRSTHELFDDYLRRGGLPVIALLEDRAPSTIPVMIDGIYQTVYMKDVVERNRLRDGRLLPDITRFLMANIGNRVSVKSIADYLGSHGIKTTQDTVGEYIGYLEKAKLFTRTKRLDSKTKQYLITSDKLYATDVGMRNALVPFSATAVAGLLENVVYNELTYRFSEVAVCDVGGMEVDFVADPLGTPSYYQVCLSLMDPNVMEREVKSLKAIGDNYPKTILTYDRFVTDDIDGIWVVNIVDWLLGAD